MNEKELIQVVGRNMPSRFLLQSIITVSDNARSKLTKEELAERDRVWELTREKKRIKTSILKSICPDCKGKLIRGKKDKKNDYKRSWTCGECKKTYNIT